MKVLVPIALTVLLAACQSGTKQASCMESDWFELGRREGAAGKTIKPEEISRYCKKAFDTNAQNLYSLGYNNGLTEFCSPANGYNMGRTGTKLPDVCPRPIDEPFKAAHSRGLKARELEAANRRIDRQISSVNQKLKTAPAPSKNLMSEMDGLRQEKLNNEKRLQEIEKNVN